jgi:hypothetical protein
MTETTTYFPALRKSLDSARARDLELDDLLKRNIVHPRWREDEANQGHLENWQVEALLNDELGLIGDDAEREIKAIEGNQAALSPAAAAEFQCLVHRFNVIWPLETEGA